MSKEKFGYCCLGVACAISRLGKWDADNAYIVKKDEDCKDSQTSCGSLSVPMAKRFCLDGKDESSLIVMNDAIDEEGNPVYTFKDIAKKIREIFKGRKKPALVVKWIKALESGRYARAQETLRGDRV